MKTASEALTRICVLGGDWNGHPVQGAPEFLDRCDFEARYDSLDVFEKGIREAITARPFVHYDTETGCVMQVSNEEHPADELDVRKLCMPNRRTIEKWYKGELDRKTRVTWRIASF